MNLTQKRVLVTGADGFIGSHLVETLRSAGCSVRALAQYNSFNSWGWLENLDLGGVEVVTGDIRDPFLCRRLVDGIDIVFHLAALIAIPYSYRAPESYVATNVQGTLNICHAALEAGCTRIVTTSTSEVYGTALYVPIDEKHPLQPQSPYSASKIGADAIAMSYHLSFDLPLVIARPFNTYGPRQSARAVIPTIISQIAAGATSIRLGDVTTTRDFNYVVDTCRGLLALAGCDSAIGKVVNIGSNRETSIAETFELIRSIMDADVTLEQDADRLRPEHSEVRRLWADSSLIRELVGFVPEVGLREGLEITIPWFHNPKNLEKYKTTIYNV